MNTRVKGLQRPFSSDEKWYSRLAIKAERLDAFSYDHYWYRRNQSAQK
jgi:hypothetical protein